MMIAEIDLTQDSIENIETVENVENTENFEDVVILNNADDSLVLISEISEQQPTIEEEQILHKSYYQRAFLGILESVLDVYLPILATEEASIYSKVLNEMEFYPQRLLVRFFLRKSGWLREGKLEYDDIVDVPGCLKKLHEDEFIERDSFVLNDYVDLLTIPELKTLVNRLGRSISNSANRDAIVDAILTVPAKSQRRICFSSTGQMSLTSSAPISALQDTLNQAQRLTGSIIQLRPEVRRTLDLAVSLYFLVASDHSAIQESLSTAILNEINRRKYPRYCIKRSGPIFANRSELEQYQQALDEEKRLAEIEVIDEDLINEISHKFQAAVDASAQSNRSYFLKRYTAGWIYCRILGSLSAALEAAKEHARAVSLLKKLLAQTQFCLGRRGKWWERLVLNTSKHLKAPQVALKLCQQALNDPLVRTTARTSLQRRFKKLSKNEEEMTEDLPDELPAEMQPEIITIQGRIQQGNSTGRKVKLHLHDDDLELGSVESFVLTEFGTQGWQGIHCESSFFTTVFGLMFWDILFGLEEQPSSATESQAKFDEVTKYLQSFVVEDVFQTVFQNAPLDLQTDAFYPARQGSIESRVRLIKTDLSAALLLLRRHHMYNYQQSCIGVDWDTFGGEEGIQLLVHVCELIGAEALSIILRQFAEDYRNHRSGLPDLLLWRNGHIKEDDLISDKDCRVLFAEVKSPNDRISDAQRYWFSVLKSAGMRVVLVQIKEKVK